MGDTIIIETPVATVLEVSGKQGPQGVPGPKGDPGDVVGLPLTTQGDTLYRGASENQRLPIGTIGQILKVSAGGIPEWGAAPATGVTSVTGTAPIASSGGNTPAISISEATTSAAGSMSAADKTKLNNAVETSRTISAGTGLTGGGDLSANRTLSVSFGSSAGTACEGNDARLSDSRNPLAHKNSHSIGQSDALAPSDIGAQSIFVTQNITSGQTLTAQRARIYTVLNFGSAYTITLPNEANGSQNGDVAVFLGASLSNPVTIAAQDQGNLVTLSAALDQYRYTFGSGAWNLTRVDSHEASRITSGTLAHERGGLEADVSAYNGLVKISGGSTSAVGIGTGSTEVAAGDHVHGNLTSDGKIGSTSGLPVVTTTAGAVTTLALGTANQVLRVNSGASGVEFADPAGGGVTGAASSASDVLGVSGSDITGVDAGSDKIVFWDDSASELTYLATVGPTFDGTTLRWPVELVIACSDETSDLTTGTAKVTFRAPYAFLLTGVRASVNTAPTGSTLIVDINNGANSALSTKLSIDASEKTSTTAATAAVIDTTYDDFSNDAEITIDIDQIGSTIAGKGLKVTLIGTRT